jgi:hypothetical protein
LAAPLGFYKVIGISFSEIRPWPWDFSNQIVIENKALK